LIKNLWDTNTMHGYRSHIASNDERRSSIQNGVAVVYCGNDKAISCKCRAVGEIYPADSSKITSRVKSDAPQQCPATNCTIRFKNEPPLKSLHSRSLQLASLESKFAQFIRIPWNFQRSFEILGWQ
jgi:hypothetical protein